MEGVFEKFNIEIGQTLSQGIAKINAFELKDMEYNLSNLRAIRDGGNLYRAYDGKYVRLIVNGQLMMSDTHMERRSNIDFVRAAKGKVMIAGLGVGLIIYAIKDKIDSGEVTKITVYEKYQDVIDLVKPILEKDFGDKIEIVCQDILLYKPSKVEFYDTIYFDIWPEITTDNLEEINLLERRWRRRLVDKASWMDSWMKYELKSIKRRY